MLINQRVTKEFVLKDESSKWKNLFSDTDMRGGGKRKHVLLSLMVNLYPFLKL